VAIHAEIEINVNRRHPVTLDVMPQRILSMTLLRRDGPISALFTILLGLFLIMALMFATCFAVWYLSGDKHIASVVGVVFAITQAVPILANVSIRIAYGPRSNYFPLTDKERILASKRLRTYVWQSSLILVLAVVSLNIGERVPAGLSFFAHAVRFCIGFATLIIGTVIGYRSLLWSTRFKPTNTFSDAPPDSTVA